MWNRPHLLVLDEPTNYLDREALGALTRAIKGFQGGVLIISHNKEFTDALCEQEWQVGGGKVVITGEETKDVKVKSHDSKNKIRKSKLRVRWWRRAITKGWAAPTRTSRPRTLS